MIRVCFHGAESTGKSTIARKLGAELGYPVVAEHGRTYAQTHGTDFTMDDLLKIARRQDELMRQASTAQQAPVLLLDTDPLMTAAWADMLFGTVPDELLQFPKAELYLLFAPDVPWVADGTRMFGGDAARARFSVIAEQVLIRAAVPYRAVAGDWAERERQARAAIAALVPSSS